MRYLIIKPLTRISLFHAEHGILICYSGMIAAAWNLLSYHLLRIHQGVVNCPHILENKRLKPWQSKEKAMLITFSAIVLMFTPLLCIAELNAENLASGAIEEGQRTELESSTNPDLHASPLPTIIITPQWRPIDAQDLPATVNVMSGQELDAAGASNTIDLQNHVPGLVLKTNAVLGQPYLRGIGSDVISAGSEASVATFVDSIYQPRAAGAIQDFYDIERVEVLKGPQAVHLGRNVVGGAISIISKDPTPYFDAYADALYGSYDKHQFRGAVNIPIKETNLAFRLAGSLIKRDGYIDNIFRDNEIDNEDFYSWRGKASYAPSNDFNLLFSTEQSREDSTRALGPQPNPNVGVSGGLLLGGTVPEDSRDVTHNVDEYVHVDTDRYSAKLFWALDSMDVQSTTAYQESDISLAIDMDGTEVDFSQNFYGESSEIVSQEIRFISNQERPFGWVAGAFYLHEDAVQLLDVHLPLAGVRIFPQGSVKTEAYALFGQLSYKFSDAWQSSAGIRYSYDRRKLDFTQITNDPLGAVGPAGTAVVRQRESKSWDAFTPELSITYIPNSNALIYAKAARGFKAGGFNTSAPQSSFDPEFLWAYELGLKSPQAEQRVRLNGSLFYYDYNDIQLATLIQGAPVGTSPTVVNAAKATIKGLDLEIWMQATNSLDLSLGVSLLDAEIDEFVSVDPNNLTANPDRSGDPLPQAPDVSLNFSANQTWSLKDYGDLALRGEYRYQSAIYFNPFKDSALKQDGYGLVNANLSFEGRRGHWYAELFGNNLTDKLYAQTIMRQDPLLGTLHFWGTPRTFGLRIGYRM